MKVTMNSDDMKFDKFVGLLKAAKMENTEKIPKCVKGIAFEVNRDDVRLQKLEESLKARNFNKIVTTQQYR